MGIIDDYFDGYYSEEMIESQVCYLFKLLAMLISFLTSHLFYKFYNT